MGYVLLFVLLGLGIGLGCCCGCSLCTTGGDFIQLDLDGTADDDNNCAACAGFNDSYILDRVPSASGQCCYEFTSDPVPCSTTYCDACKNNPDCTQQCVVAADKMICDPGQAGADCNKHAVVTEGANCLACPSNVDCSTPSSAGTGDTCTESDPLNGDCKTCDCVFDGIDNEWYCDCIETDACGCEATCPDLVVAANLCLTVNGDGDIVVSGGVNGPGGIQGAFETTLTGSGNPIDCLALIDGLDLYPDTDFSGESIGQNLCTRFTTITATAL